MSEELYAPIPDLDAYLARIGIAEAKEPTLDFLDEVIMAHQCSVPFDDLDTCALDIVPSLGIPDLFEKIVVRKRGGYCFELNALFGALLKALGFQVLEIDGNDPEQVYDAFTAPHETGKPKAIVGYTVKGKGVSFMENNNDWHHNRLTDTQLAAALAELEAAE